MKNMVVFMNNGSGVYCLVLLLTTWSLLLMFILPNYQNKTSGKFRLAQRRSFIIANRFSFSFFLSYFLNNIHLTFVENFGISCSLVTMRWNKLLGASKCPRARQMKSVFGFKLNVSVRDANEYPVNELQPLVSFEDLKCEIDCYLSSFIFLNAEHPL